MEHTKLPWKVRQERQFKDGTPWWEVDNVCIIFDSGGQPAEANAEFIVKACNAHYDLIESCKAAIDTIEALYADILESTGKNCDIDSEMVYTTDETRQKLNKAIAKAEGK